MDEFTSLFEEFTSLLEEFFTSVFNFNVMCGVIAAIIVFIIEIKLMKKKTKKNKKVEKAKSLGHIVKGKRIKYWADDPHSVNSWYHATYTYEVDGKEYKYKYMNKVVPPFDVTLYYINSPRKTFTAYEYKQNYSLILYYIIPIAVAIIVINCLGGV